MCNQSIKYACLAHGLFSLAQEQHKAITIINILVAKLSLLLVTTKQKVCLAKALMKYFTGSIP
jgi:hypothetical protein